MDIESQSLTTCEVAPNGNTVVLGFTDSRGAPARIRLPLNQLGALAVTLPDLINKALQSRYGDHTLRYACPRASPLDRSSRMRGGSSAARMRFVRAPRTWLRWPSRRSASIEQVFPSTVLIESLRTYRKRFPLVSVNLFAEGLGAPEQSLFEGNARLAIYSTALDGMPGFQMEFLGDVPISRSE